MSDLYFPLQRQSLNLNVKRNNFFELTWRDRNCNRLMSENWFFNRIKSLPPITAFWSWWKRFITLLCFKFIKAKKNKMVVWRTCTIPKAFIYLKRSILESFSNNEFWIILFSISKNTIFAVLNALWLGKKRGIRVFSFFFLFFLE